MTRVAILAESERLRRELAEVLRASGRFEVVADDAESLDIADVVLIEGGAASGAALKAIEEGQALVFLSDGDDGSAAALRGRGGVALLSAASTPQQIVASVEAAGAGLIVVSVEHANATASFAGEDPLTPREREVLQMLAAGLGNKEIGARLGISDHTAKFHVSQILGKLNAGSRAEAVSIGMRRGIVPL
jgi:two-component system nitrate/nitrite response regulator NarL